MRLNVRLAALVARRALLALVGLVLAYGGAGMIGGAVPVNRDWQAPAQGVTIWVESNGVHTGIVVPKVAAGVDWRWLARPEHLADPRYARHDHLSFGWGERAFYLETPTWADVKLATVLAAALGSAQTLVHVDHVPRPSSTGDVRAIVVTPEQYRRLAGYIAATVAPGARSYRGYYGYDAFYDGTGRYSAVRTCNAWTGAALAHAGVRVGWWTPFPATVMWWF
ncbi:TIGR02117 family protein [Sphingomonas sp.]|jgi:uncharacterized protein (TIGR02117 family)|uniref:TIGR02117 family protein n=1 Tax=Sphingomonas sp. TaxID=28214 RepID=UPI002D80E7BC|nr:TIGR02117 family protein [Sphingomonas sp.]HEU0043155.1 TIGR02117 family protein [Sphingomonas sp.]